MDAGEWVSILMVAVSFFAFGFAVCNLVKR